MKLTPPNEGEIRTKHFKEDTVVTLDDRIVLTKAVHIMTKVVPYYDCFTLVNTNAAEFCSLSDTFL